ncbi:hypothetical protein SAMN02910371_03465 [Butyrivibrio sp. INlla14]|nr:hypothetical protein SAMN02910371_03465 [Butyrivibrio sp. INlla14]
MDLIPKCLFTGDFNVGRKLRILGKLIMFLSVLIFCLWFVNGLFIPKYYYNEVYSTTNTYKDFYKLQKNSVDVLFFGSSHAACAFNPQVIYDKYGITSYNLASEQQSLVVTYYWLEEALKYQSPKVVILDTYTFHYYFDAYVYNDMNCSEGAVRKAMDFMRLSPTKVEAAVDIERIDPTQDKWSILFPIIRYHTRWANLDEEDYVCDSMVEHGAIKGYALVGDKKPGASTVTFKASDVDGIEEEPMVKIADEYLDRIVNCCRKKGIELVFTNIPCAEPISRYKATKCYADENGIPFYDFNEESLYNKIDYDVEENAYGHPNYLGAEKISSYLGEVLARDYGIKPRIDNSYELSGKNYDHKVKNILIDQTEDVYDFLEMINDTNYSIFIFAPTDYRNSIDEKALALMQKLGVTDNLLENEVGVHYCFVKDANRVVIEKETYDDFSFSGSIRGGLATYSFTIDTTNLDERYRKYSMIVDGKECGTPKQGIDIVVYDNEYSQIVSEINIDKGNNSIDITRY